MRFAKVFEVCVFVLICYMWVSVVGSLSGPVLLPQGGPNAEAGGGYV